MKSSSKNVVLSIVLVITTLLVLGVGVNANSLILTTNTTNNTVNTNTATNTLNIVATNTPATTTNTATNTAKNVVVVNNINSGASKDIPQTGESDVYVISAIAMVAVAIGTVAFIKSKKYDL